MKVGMVFPASWRARSVQALTWSILCELFRHAMAAQGVEVKLFGLDPPPERGPIPPLSDSDSSALECLSLGAAMEEASEFDLLHTHDNLLSVSYAPFVKIPIVSSFYGRLSEGVLPIFRKWNHRCAYVSASDASRDSSLDYAGTIYPAVDASVFNCRAKPGDHLLWYGPVGKTGGVRDAVEIALRSDRKLLIVGNIEDPDYYEMEIARYVDGSRIRHAPSLSPEKLGELWGKAAAVLCTSEEPAFPLHILESNACGTPVVGFNRGTMAEIVKIGENGILAADMDRIVEEVRRIDSWDRSACRRFVEERFNMERMACEYVQLYRAVLERTKPHAAMSRPPWGLWTVLEDSPTYKVKRVDVLPGKRLSYQLHYKRSEHWMIVQGQALVTLDDRKIPLEVGEYIDIPAGVKHRIENPGTTIMSFIEVQQGTYFGEDDIIRLEDDYGRKGTVC
ncbi:glycosyltransferase [Syntrophobacter fumaroxidans]|uniref:Mannose-6-phosphate isomerase, type II n=1 Tax=Syntrophobacter fumaroxidans (strain DSM 10017 / MPOB) TaxID=335543 RepID=A0LNJ6_SYNFM|nr:glycosyltransferase [Syntrophobacter fumaroxidans]ABK18998.1 mannose-6-phosphate isomerase, type II [Syntrophobacter fumaroxidans MPOB]